MSWSKPIVLPSIRTVCFLLSGQCATAHASALAPVPMMTLPFFAQKVDCYFLSYACHLTQIWDACEASCKLPMAKANMLLLALQWSSFTMSCHHLLIRKGFSECTSILSGVEIALMDPSLHGLSCAAGILDLRHWDATLGLDGVGLRLIWHRNLSHMEHTPSARPRDTDSDLTLFVFSPVPERSHLLPHTSNCRPELIILDPEHQLCSNSKAWRIHFLIKWPLLNTFQFVS